MGQQRIASSVSIVASSFMKIQTIIGRASAIDMNLEDTCGGAVARLIPMHVVVSNKNIKVINYK